MEDEEYEFNRRDRPPAQQEEDPAEEEETSFYWFNRNEKQRVTPQQLRQEFKDTSKAIGEEKRRYTLEATNEKKKFFRENLEFKTSKNAGRYSKDLYENSELVRNQKTGDIIGLDYKGVRVIVKTNRYSGNRKNLKVVNEFKQTLREAENEHKGSADALIEETTGTFDETVNTTVKQDFVDTTRRELRELQEESTEALKQARVEVDELLGKKEKYKQWLKDMQKENQKLKTTIENQVLEKDRERDDLLRKNKQLEQDLNSNQKSVAELTEQLENQKQTLLKKTKDLEKKNSALKKSLNEEEQRGLERTEELNTNISTLENQLEEKTKTIQGLNLEISNFKQTQGKLDGQDLVNLNAQIRKLQTMLTETENQQKTLQKELQNYKNQLAQEQNKSRDLEARIQLVEKETQRQVELEKANANKIIEEKNSEMQNLRETNQELKKQIERNVNRERNLRNQIDANNQEVRRLTQELGTLQIERGQELAKRRREHDEEIRKYKTEVKKLSERYEQEKQTSAHHRKEIEQLLQDAGGETEKTKLLRGQLTESQNQQDILQEKLASANLSLRQAEQENVDQQKNIQDMSEQFLKNEQDLKLEKKQLQARIQALETENQRLENSAGKLPKDRKKLERIQAQNKDKIVQLETQNQSLQDQLEAERKSRMQTQSLLEKFKTNQNSGVKFTPDELREMNSIFKESVLFKNTSTQEKIDALEIEQKHWLQKFESEPDPRRKQMFENIKDYARKTLNLLFVELNRKPEYNPETLVQIAETNEFTKWQQLKNWLRERNMLRQKLRQKQSRTQNHSPQKLRHNHSPQKLRHKNSLKQKQSRTQPHPHHLRIPPYSGSYLQQ